LVIEPKPSGVCYLPKKNTVFVRGQSRIKNNIIFGDVRYDLQFILEGSGLICGFLWGSESLPAGQRNEQGTKTPAHSFEVQFRIKVRNSYSTGTKELQYTSLLL
jgi:hypothetical protein